MYIRMHVISVNFLKAFLFMVKPLISDLKIVAYDIPVRTYFENMYTSIHLHMHVQVHYNPLVKSFSLSLHTYVAVCENPPCMFTYMHHLSENLCM